MAFWKMPSSMYGVGAFMYENTGGGYRKGINQFPLQCIIEI